MRPSFLALILAAACSSAATTPDTGTPDSGPFSVAGTVAVHPLAASWFAAQRLGVPPVEELAVRLQDPFVVSHTADAGSYGSYAVGPDGKFTFASVEMEIALGVTGLVTDHRAARDAGLLRPRVAVTSQTFLLEGKSEDVAGVKAWALPVGFVAALGAALGEPDLEAKGFLLGMVLDAQGQPAAGLGIVGHDLDPARLRYLDPDLEPNPGSATTSSGAFVVVGEVEPMTFAIAARDLPPKRALAVPGQGFAIVFQLP